MPAAEGSNKSAIKYKQHIFFIGEIGEGHRISMNIL